MADRRRGLNGTGKGERAVPLSVVRGGDLVERLEPAPTPIAPIVPLLLRAREAAALCGVSEVTWWRWHERGVCPAPVTIGEKVHTGGGKGGPRTRSTMVRWHRHHVEEWIANGCPDLGRKR